MNLLDEDIWLLDSGRAGQAVCIAFGLHGNERPPIDAGLRTLARFKAGELSLTAGRLLLVLGNPKARAENQRWSEGGVDLNRCFHASDLAREPQLYEEHRARQIVAALEESGAEVLVDFHCTVEPGRRFLMQHPATDNAAHRDVALLLQAEVLLCDPELRFGGVSLDEWMSTRERVGFCYETGWMNDPTNTPEAVCEEMENLLAGLGLVTGRKPAFHDGKQRVELVSVLTCEGSGFRWSAGIGENLQALGAGTLLGAYGDGRGVALEADATLIFPKKRAELVELGKPLVYLAKRCG